MCSADMEVIQNPEVAAVKPRERQFQVVPMPGVFTRGRWKCWDYYMDREDGQSEKKDQMLDFEKGKEKEGDLVVQENFTADIVTATTAIAADGSATYITTQETFSDDKMTPVKESSTFIVTSIAAAPQTPQHGTPQSSNDILERMKNSPMDVYTQDLVKTHLTFAVREEVEVLRQTITDLENRVAALESENQLLRQYAPSDIVSSLPNIVSQLKANSAPQTSSVAPSLPPPKVPAGFCSTIFANTLNNVVAEVSREISGQAHQ